MSKEITFTHVNIRQSITILIGKIFAIDFIAAVILIALYYGIIISGATPEEIAIQGTILFLILFIIVGIVKLVLDGYVILSWLNEYYEITPEYIIHKRGIIFKKTEKYKVDLVRAMDVQDSFIGQLFNFATITLYDIRLKKYLDMYLIHNANRYAKIIQHLRPDVEVSTDEVRMSLRNRQDEELVENVSGDIEEQANR